MHQQPAPLPRQFYAGLLFVVLGAAAGWHSLSYQIGTAAVMGPGYFPLALSIGLMLCGLVAMVKAWLNRSGPLMASWHLSPLIMLVASLVVFALLVQRAGLFISVFATVLIASLQNLRDRPIEVVGTALFLSCFCVGVFIYALGINL